MQSAPDRGIERGNQPGPDPLVAPLADAWTVIIRDDLPAGPRARESLLCLADGTVGTRCSLEEDGAGSTPMVLPAGVYDLGDDGSPRLLEIPTWIRLDLEGTIPGPGTFTLDLRTGFLMRQVADRNGLILRSVRFASLRRPGIGVLHAELRGNFALGNPAATTRSKRVALSRLGGGVALEMSTSRTTSLRRSGGSAAVVLERIASFESNARNRPTPSRAASRLDRALAAGFDTLAIEQRKAWQRRWLTADIEIAGQPELTRRVRFGLFHLISSVNPRDGGDAALPARGLSGPAYLGHVFWDADVFAFPFFAATSPASARAMLRYRIRRLGAAQEAARLVGRSGARFPWESADDGREVTPRFAYDSRGRPVPILSGIAEEHITADVAWAAWQYAAWTGDLDFLLREGWPLMIETARYWASRVSVDGDGGAHLTGVVGPDEYHELVDDNAFTNVMAAWNLDRAADLVEHGGLSLPLTGDAGPPGSRALDGTGPPFPDPSESTDLLDHARRWRQLAGSLVTGLDPATGVYEQFSGYHRLEPLLAAELGTPPFPADLVAGRDRVIASQVIKQADVLMLHFMIPDDIMPGSLRPNLQHYLPRTCHGSSLSPAVHAGLLARGGYPDQAVHLLDIATRLDLDDLTGTTSGGLHMANYGGIWQALVTGFGGIRPGFSLEAGKPSAPVLTIDPHLPRGWSGMTVRLEWQGSPLTVTILQDGGSAISCSAPLEVRLGRSPVSTVEPPGTTFENGA